MALDELAKALEHTFTPPAGESQAQIREANGLATAALAHGFGQALEYGGRFIPTEAAIGYRLAVGEFAAGFEILTATKEVAFEHHAENVGGTSGDVVGDGLRNQRLFAGVFWLLPWEQSTITRGGRPRPCSCSAIFPTWSWP